MTEALPADSNGDVLVLKAAGQRWTLPATDIVEIIRPPTITRVPHSLAGLTGVANFRGTVLPIISVNALLGKEAGTPSRTTRVVVVKRETAIGLIVDEVSALAKSSDAIPMDLDALLHKNFGSQARPIRKRAIEAKVADSPVDEAHEELVFLAFEVGRQEYALPLNQVEGIATLPDAIAGMPRTDRAMIGAAEIGGSLVPLVSLGALLGFTNHDLASKTARIVLAQLGGALVGVVVDGVREILRVGPNALDPVPPVLTRAKGEAQIEAICRLDGGRRLISILSPTRLFDADTVTRVLAETERGSSHMASDQAELDDAEQFIVFQLGNESYGLPIGSVDEVVRCPDSLTRVPKAPAFVRGLMNLRGRAVPVIDQRQRFSAGGDLEDNRRRIVVVTTDGLQAGFLVDKVLEVLNASASELRPAPDLSADAAHVIDRVAMIERDGHMILLVDPRALLDRAERDVLAVLGNTSEAPRIP